LPTAEINAVAVSGPTPLDRHRTTGALVGAGEFRDPQVVPF
jgi:hypothetical protein